MQVTGLMTQGRGDGTEWVVSYLLSHSLDAFHWQYVYDQYSNQRVSLPTSDLTSDLTSDNEWT